jgi:hypothetical protein
MDILVAILIIAAIAAVAFVVLRRKPGAVAGAGRPHASPLGRPGRVSRRSDPMAAAVAEHAQATHPADVVAAEQQLRAQARSVAAGLNGSAAAAHADPAYGQPASYADPAYAQPAPGPTYDGTAHGPAAAGGGYYAPASAAASSDPNLDRDFDPATGERIDGHEDPANDPRLNDSRYDGRLAADYVDPRQDDGYR